MIRPLNSWKFVIRMLVGAAAAFCVGIFANHLFVESVRGTADAVPFTATVLKIYYNSDGNEGMRETLVMARKSDGSKAVNTVRNLAAIQGRPPQSAEFRQVKDVGKKRSYDIFPVAESVSSISMSDTELRALTARRNDCVMDGDGWKTDPNPKPATILGETVVKRTLDIPPDPSSASVTHEEWVAPELNCFPLRQSGRQAPLADPGREVVRSTYEVVELTVGEPDQELFRVPEQFTERSPREIQEEISRRRGEAFESNHAVEMRTERYHERRAASP